MTTLKQLNELARECEVCALEDTRSISKHLMECGTCSDYRQKADSFSTTLNEVRKIVAKEDDARHRDLHERISKMANMEEGARFESFTGLIDATAILPEMERIKMVRTRTDIIVDFPKYERDPIIKTMKEVTRGWDKERKRVEMNALTKATEDYPVYKKVMIRNMFGKMME